MAARRRRKIGAVYGAGLLQGLALVTFPAASGVFTTDFLAVGRGLVGPVPVPVIVTVVVVIGLQVFLTFTRFGRQLEAVGANANAPRQRWTEDQAWTYMRAQPWPLGSNFLPVDAINQLEMFQAATFLPDRPEPRAQSCTQRCRSWKLCWSC